MTTDDLGARLRATREQRQLTREALGAMTETSPLTILRAELHGSSPTIGTLQAWAAALDVPIGFLLTGATVGPDAA